MSNNILAQKKDGWCGPAALSFALLKQGEYIPQETIVKETGTTITQGVDPNPLISFAKEKGYKTKIYSDGDPNTTLALLDVLVKKGESIIVDYLAGTSFEDGHYVVVQGVTDSKIKIFDPSSGKNDEIPRKYFIKHWKDKTRSGKVFKYWAFSISH